MLSLHELEQSARPYAPGTNLRAPFSMRNWREMGVQTKIEWVVKGLFERETLNLIYGPSGCGKSFLVFYLGASVARCMPFFGHKTTLGPVVFVACEGGRSGDRRKWAYCEYHDFSAEIPFYQLECTPNLRDQRDVDEFIALLNTLSPSLIIIDTLNRALMGGDENSSQDIGAAIAATGRITDETGATVILVHHSGKDTGQGPRGHSSLYAACDTVIEVSKNDFGSCAKVTKSRDGETDLEMPFKLEQVVLGEDEDGDPITSCVVVPNDTALPNRGNVRLSAQQKIALQVLKEALAAAGEKPPASNHIPQTKQVVRIDLWKGYCEKRRLADTDKSDSFRRAFQRCSNDLQASGIIGICGDYVWLCD